MNQLGFPSLVTTDEIARERSLGGAISLCAKVAGLAPKQIQDALRSDRSQFSRWTDDKEGILWSKLRALMDLCGNESPLLWMVWKSGFDLSAMRRQETELERELRIAREWIKQLEEERRIERSFLGEVLAGRVQAERAMTA
jgi:hypothetical protein